MSKDIEGLINTILNLAKQYKQKTDRPSVKCLYCHTTYKVMPSELERISKTINGIDNFICRSCKKCIATLKRQKRIKKLEVKE